jgi:hypothetical protein
MPEIRFTQQCLPIDDLEMDLSDLAFGTMQLFSAEIDYHFTLKEIRSGIEHRSSIESKNFVLESEVSPNRNMVTVMGYDEQHTKAILWVLDARANILAETSIQRTDLGALRWLDNERLTIETDDYGVLVLVNPFTGEQRVINNELPDLEPRIRWPIAYSSDLEWVTYYSWRQKNSQNSVEGPVVYDVAKQQTIWNAGNGAGSNPAWSPDGQELAFTSGMDEYQLYLFSRTGNIKAVLDDSLPHKAFAFSWSPDGNYIAFWNADSLMVYDRQKDWVFDTCVPGYEIGVTGSPLWSPDSQQIIVHSGSTQPLLVDWEKQRVYKINYIEDSMIIGWMNSP